MTSPSRVKPAAKPSSARTTSSSTDVGGGDAFARQYDMPHPCLTVRIHHPHTVHTFHTMQGCKRILAKVLRTFKNQHQHPRCATLDQRAVPIKRLPNKFLGYT